MKAVAKDKPKKFEPFTVELTFETPEEVAGLYALLNHYGLIRVPVNFVDAAREINGALARGNGGEPDVLLIHSNLCQIITLSP